MGALVCLLVCVFLPAKPAEAALYPTRSARRILTSATPPHALACESLVRGGLCVRGVMPRAPWRQAERCRHKARYGDDARLSGR
ncbi:hypothetical protein DFH27DRAFT_43890 [Peziza echinospora]|nr:hypothetical protein DFH27DRAFT_43890 [Peziza echinospora]